MRNLAHFFNEDMIVSGVRHWTRQAKDLSRVGSDQAREILCEYLHSVFIEKLRMASQVSRMKDGSSHFKYPRESHTFFSWSACVPLFVRSSSLIVLRSR